MKKKVSLLITILLVIKETSLDWMKKYYHPGALYLLHGVSKGNAQALDEFIIFIKDQGYSLDIANNIR